jgi:transposase
VELILTPGQTADVTQAEPLLQDHVPEAVIADKGYDSDELVAAIEAKPAEAVIPPRHNRRQPRDYDRTKYKARNVVEGFMNRIKHFRRVATRYEKTARNFLAFAHLASILVLLE